MRLIFISNYTGNTVDGGHILISIGGWYNRHKEKIKVLTKWSIHRKLVGLAIIIFFLLDGIMWF